MAVGWQQKPFPGPTPFFGYPQDEMDGGTGMPVPTLPPVGGVGAPVQPQEATQPIFAPQDMFKGGMFGDTPPVNNKPQEKAPEGDWPSEDAIERRRKLAEALMGKQMEVNHPVQAVANAVSQIAGAYVQNRADREEADLLKRRRDFFLGALKDGGDFDGMMTQAMGSPDPYLQDMALKYKLAALQDRGKKGGKPEETEIKYSDGTAQSAYWDTEQDRWVPYGERYPRFAKAVGGGGGGGGGGGSVGAGERFAPVKPVETSEQDPSQQAFSTPGPRGKYSLKEGPQMNGPDGRPVYTTYNPNDGNYYYRSQDGLWRVASGQRSVSPMTEQQFYKLKLERQDEVNGLKALQKYFKTVKDIPTGVQRWSIDISGKFKTFLGQQGLTENEFNLMDSRAKVQALLGMFRTTIVGPGVMTEYDAIRVLQALGGDPASALQNPAVMQEILSDLYTRKYERALEIQKTYEDQLKARGIVPKEDGLGVPENLSVQEPSKASGARGLPLPRREEKGLLKDGEIYNVKGRPARWDAAKQKFYPVR